MLISKNTKTCIVSFIIIISLLFTIQTPLIRAQEDEEFDLYDIIFELLSLLDFDDPLTPHPYRYIGLWESNSTFTIKGNMTFNLFFSTPFITQFDLFNKQDTVNVSVYYVTVDGSAKLIPNANLTVELNPEKFSESIQQFEITLSGIEYNVTEGDQLLFSIEMIHSKKCINNFAENTWDIIIKKGLLFIANQLKNSDNPESQEYGLLIEAGLENLSALNIEGNDIADVFNAARSSAFYFGSSSLNSNIVIESDDGIDRSLYFHQTYYENATVSSFIPIPFIRVVNSSNPSIDNAKSWPTVALHVGDINLLDDQEELLNWFIAWGAFILGEPIKEPVENVETYYLYGEGKMNKTKPVISTTIKSRLSEGNLTWTGPTLSRNKNIKSINADLYLYIPKLLLIGKNIVTVSLFDGENEIASQDINLDSSNIGFGSTTLSTNINFSSYDQDYEIWNDHELTLKITSDETILNFLRGIKLNYGSSEYPSKLSVELEDTDNIKIEGLEDRIVYAGGSTKYELQVNSMYQDEIEITYEEKDKTGEWQVEIIPETLTIDNDEGFAQVQVYVNSTSDDISSYESDEIELFINGTGKTGFNSTNATVTVSKDAVIYEIDVIKPDDLKIKPGKDGAYQFKVRNLNKGLISDRYIIEAESEHDWELNYVPYIEQELQPYDISNDEAIVNITVSVPRYTEEESDILTVTIISEENEFYSIEFNVTTNVEQLDILESLGNLFEDSEIIVVIIIILLIMLIIILAYFRRRKHVKLICLDRIREITPDSTAVYEIAVNNPRKYSMTYNIKTNHPDKEKWNISTNESQIVVEPKQSKPIKLFVKPTTLIKEEDWVEVKITAQPVNGKKPEEISTVTTIIKARIDLKISAVFHWPKIFKKGERVDTSFKLNNDGNISAQEISVVLYINGKEKNRVDNITIPRGGHAEIKIPWIAEKGKNEIYIVVL